ncbi:MAG TPA: hypothetical protein VFO77_15390 [Actinoplanes sp.]|nr:hypothetical protein [Actinoplanes sp.]
MSETPRTGRSAKMIAAAVVVGLMGSGALVWQASSAAFTATTSNTGNTWTSGTVSLTDNDAGVARFTVSNAVPLQTGTNCIQVTYGGNVSSTVKIYAENPSGTLGQYLDFDIERGDADDTCAAADGWTQIFGDAGTTIAGSDDLTTFTTDHTDFSDGIAGWQPAAAATMRAYRFTWTLSDNNAAQNKSAGVDFVWEAQND